MYFNKQATNKIQLISTVSQITPKLTKNWKEISWTKCYFVDLQAKSIASLKNTEVELHTIEDEGHLENSALLLSNAQFASSKETYSNLSGFLNLGSAKLESISPHNYLKKIKIIKKRKQY